MPDEPTSLCREMHAVADEALPRIEAVLAPWEGSGAAGQARVSRSAIQSATAGRAR